MDWSGVAHHFPWRDGPLQEAFDPAEPRDRHGKWVRGIPHYDGSLSLTKAAGGSNGAMFAKDSGGRRWLVKTYGGNEDRVATEALSNAIYREMGAVVPAAGLHERDGKKALTYPTVEGTFKWDGPSRQVGAHFMTDALLANHDVLGQEDDNILTAPSGRRVRLDQGGTLEFRAMGQSKEFGHTVPEVESMMAKPSRQGYRSSKVTMPELRSQAAEIHRTLTPERVDALVNQAPFKDSAMRERVRAALKARVQWMGRFATGHETASIPHLQEVDLSEFHLGEGVSIQHLWDEAKHPRDEHGRFIDKLSDLKKGETVHLDSKTSIKRDKDGTLRVVRSGGIIKGFTHPADAARAALDRSAKSKDADSVGGATSHKDYNAYLKAHPIEVASIDSLSPFQQSTGQVPFGAEVYDEKQAETQLSLIKGRLQTLQTEAKTDKYKARAVPTVQARATELKAKVKALGGNHMIEPTHVAHVPASPSPPTHAHGLKVGDKFSTKDTGSVYTVTKSTGSDLHYTKDGTEHGTEHEYQSPHGVISTQVEKGLWTKVEGGGAPAPEKPLGHPFIQGTIVNTSIGGEFKVTKTTGEGIYIQPTKDPTSAPFFRTHAVAAQHFESGGWKLASTTGGGPDLKVGTVVHNPKNSYQGKVAQVDTAQKMYQLEGAGGVKAWVGFDAFGPTGNMKVGPHPDYVAAGNAPDVKIGPKGKIGGKQTNGLGEAGGPAQIGKLDLTHGDKLQMKKGGHNYTIISTAGGVTKVQGPSGSTKYLSNYDRPQFVQKADKTALKLKDPGGSAPTPGAPVAVPAASHAEHLAKIKADLASSLGGTPLSSASSAVFSTPGGKTLFKKPDGSVWNLETGAQVNVAGNVEPPKLTTLSPTLARAELALQAKKPATPAAPAPPPKPDAHWDSLPTGQAAENKLVAHQGGEYGSKVPDSAKGSIGHYTNSGYTAINPQLRTPRHIGNMSTEKAIIAMDKAMVDVGGVPEEMVIWRGVNGKTGNDYQAAGKGDVIRDNGFISASVEEDFAHNWTSSKLVMKIRLPKGAKGVYVGPGTGLSGHLSEKELILNRGIAFEVIDRRVEHGNTVLVVEPVSGHL